MLTIKDSKDAKGLKEYFDDHLSVGDYYSESETKDGKFIGKLRAHFNLPEEVGRDAFHALTDGLNPRTGQFLNVRRGERRIPAYDHVFSAPKSLSIMALAVGDQRLEQAHERVVARVFEEVEKRAQTRVRRGLFKNARQRRTTGSLLAAKFTHHTSRELDPQLHTHCVVFNTTYDAEEKRLKALDAFEIYTSSPLISEIYRNELAREVRLLGYDIEEGRQTWRLKCVPLEVEDTFSKRSRQIKNAAREFKEKYGIEPNARQTAGLARSTRAEKEEVISKADLVRGYKAQIDEKDWTVMQRGRNQAVERELSGIELDREEPATEEAVNYAIEHILERSSVAPLRKVVAAALKHSAGRTTLKQIDQVLKGPRFVTRGEDIMTREERAREVSLVAFVKDGKRCLAPLGCPTLLSPVLTPEQAKAAKCLLESRDRVVFLRGAAGTGKTVTLAQIGGSVSVSSGRQPVVCAPSSSAVETLRKEGFKDAVTLQKLLYSPDEFELEQATVVVDEAGLMSTKQMEELFRLVEARNARILLVGDTRQHKSVESGDALRLLEEYSCIEKAELSTIARQKKEIYRNAIQSLANGQALRGFEDLDKKLGAIQEASKEDRPSLVAKEYIAKLNEGKSTLIVTPTWRENDLVSEKVRENLKQQGSLNSERELLVYRSLNFTKIEKARSVNFEPEKMYLSFHWDRGEFKQGETWKVLHRNDHQRTITVEKDDRRITFKPRDFFRSFDVVEKQSKQFCVGEKILVQSNYTSSQHNRIPNGSVVQIEQFRDDGSIQLQDGRILGAEFRQFIHGYAVTSQASQGRTVDHVIVSVDSAAKMALSKEQLYV